MGFCSSSTTQKTTLPDATDEENALMAIERGMIDAILQESGYDVKTEQVFEYENPARVEMLQSTVTGIQDQIVSIQNELANLPVSSGNRGNLENQIRIKKDQLNVAMNQLATEQKKSVTKYDTVVTKAEDKRVTDLRSQGKDAEADALQAELAQTELSNLDQQDKIYAGFLDAAEKLVSGDMSITPEQEAQIQDLSNRYRDPIMSAINQIKTEIGVTEGTVLDALDSERGVIGQMVTGISTALDGLSNRIGQTGLDVEAALVEAEARVQATGVNLNQALDASIEASRALAEQNLFETTKDIRLKNAMLATSLGRNSTDSAFVAQLNEDLLDAVKSTELTLAVEQASGKLKITERTGAALESIANYRTDLALNQGRRLEGVEQAKVDLAQLEGQSLLGVQQRETGLRESTGLRREDVAKLRSGVEEQTAKYAAGLRNDAAQPLTALQSGSGAMNQLNQNSQLNFQNLLSANNPLMQNIQQYQDLRKSQPTTTTTETGSVLSGIFSGLGVAASGAGTVMGGIGALKPAQSIFNFGG